MAKVTNPGTVKSSLRTFKEFPLSQEEISEIKEIQKEQYWNRKKLKEQFCNKYKRLRSEVDDYFKKNKRIPDGGTGKKKSGITAIKGAALASGGKPISAIPQGTEPAPAQGINHRLTAPGGPHITLGVGGITEFRLKYKSLKVDTVTNELIFEL